MTDAELKAGDEHYRAYVGPPAQYDFMGATQFRLLCALGLRAGHQLLDVGCGSLRAGRFLIAYLERGGYCGIEPNQWLVEEALDREVGRDLVRLKEPSFHDNTEFDPSVFSRRFDFILAQSIFSHAGRELTVQALRRLGEALAPTGLMAVTFVEGFRDFKGRGWVYPGVVRYRRGTIREMAEEAGLFAARIPWFHPRQTWYLLSRRKERLPTRRMRRVLTGAVLFDDGFSLSWNRTEQVKEAVRKPLVEGVLHPLGARVRRLLGRAKSD